MSNAVKAREIFFDAIEKDSREAMQECIDVACRDDQELRLQVERLLHSHQKAGEFLGGDPSTDSTTIIPSITEKPGDHVGPYRLLQQIGEGGFGVVYMAEQTAPVRRKVALKIIKPGMDTKEVVARFEVERQALALMDHPNIAKVLDAGSTDSGRPYFVMELVRGIPITDYCGQEKIAVNERLDLFVKVCQAIQHAHQKGLIHRDIKPSNILVTMHDGIPVPKVIDFGIAKATQQLTEKTLFTQFHQFIGTPAYMSPEQAELSGLDIDTRSDVYSLGVLLYELLTGATPFDAKELLQSGLDAMRKIIREREPERPSSRLSQTLSKATPSDAQDVAKLPRRIESDLDWIVMKCLEKDRTRRYETANGLAMDLRRFLTQEPILARPPSTLYRIRQAWRRNRVIYSAGCVVAASLVLGIVTSSIAMRQARVEQEKAVQAQIAERNRAQEADEARRKVEDSAQETKRALEVARVQELAARRHAYAGDMNVAKQAIDSRDFGRAMDLLDRNRPSEGQEDLRGWEWRYLWQFCRSDAVAELYQAKTPVVALDVSHDGKQVAVVNYRPAGVTLIDIQTRQPSSIPAAADLLVSRVAFHPQLPWLVVAGRKVTGETYELRMIDIDSEEQLWGMETAGECLHLQFAGELHRLVSYSMGDPHQIHVIDPHTPTDFQLHEIESAIKATTIQRNYIRSWNKFTVSPDGEQCVHNLRRGTIEALDLTSGTVLWKHVGGSLNLAYSQDGKMVAMGGTQNIVQLLDSASGEELDKQFKGHTSWVARMLFFDNDQTLITCGADQTIRIWDVQTRRETNRLIGARNEIWAMKAIPGTSWLVSGGKDGKITLWDRQVDPHPRDHIVLPDTDIEDCRLRHDGSAIVTLHISGKVKEWRSPRFDTSSTLFELPSQPVTAPSLSLDGELIATHDQKLGTQVWNVREQSRVLWSQIHARMPRYLTFASNRRLAIFYSDSELTVLDPLTGQSMEPPPTSVYPEFIQSYARSPSTEMFVFTVNRPFENEFLPLAVLQNLSTQQVWQAPLNVHEAYRGSAISWDDRFVGVPTDPGDALVLSIPELTVVKRFRGHLTGTKAVTFSPDGTRILTLGNGMKLFDFQSEDELLTLKANIGWDRMRFSADGSLLTVHGGGRVAIWRAPNWDEIETAEGKRHVVSP